MLRQIFYLNRVKSPKTYVKEAYKQAIEEKYKFYSYGDAMLIL